MESTPKRLFLLDAYALIFRAYYALIKMPRITQAGFNTSAIFGFVNTLEEVLRKENPSHIAVCFDPVGPTFRNEAYGEYKAERAATPEDIKLSIPIIKEIIKAYNIEVVEVAGFEADDVIGTLAKHAEREKFTTYMMTPDKDYGQLVSPSVLQYKPSYRGQDFEIRGEREVCERYGIERTEQVVDLLALWGDKSDNIPGCPGVGEKTAVKLINDFGSVEGLLEHTDSLKGALKKKVEDNAEQIRFSKFLATIRTDVPLDADIERFATRKPDRSKLFAIFKELEFKTLIERVGRRLDVEEGKAGADKPVIKERKSATVSQALSLFDEFDFGASPISEEEKLIITDSDYRLADSAEELEALSRALDGNNRCAIWILSEGDTDATATFIGAAVAPEEGKAWYIPAISQEGVALLLDLMARPDIEKVSVNSKRDYVLAARLRGDGEQALGNYYDLMLAQYVVQPELRHDLQRMSSVYLRYELPATPKASATLQELTRTCCQFADISLRLYGPLTAAVEKADMKKLLNDMELPLVRVLAEMELTGVRIDTEALRQAQMEMETRITAIEAEIFEMAGETFNVGSPAKVGEILFDKLELEPKGKKTKTGQYSTGEEVLEKLLTKHPIVGKILEYRQLKKLVSTYLSTLPTAINPATGKVHTNYNQTVTATGRLSSSNPNLQNIPVRDNEGRGIRRAFIADEGCLFLSADYSQIELRLIADFADDKIMLDAFRHGRDIHAITAARIYHKDVEDVTREERRNAKTANFGIIYGISAFGLANRLSIPRGEAKDIIDNYFLTFPTISKYMSDSVDHAREKGYVLTKMGRRRILPDINSRNPVVRGYAERNAVNAPIQGTAADIIKVAMISIFQEIERRGLKSRMIMQVHDELNFNVPENEAAEMQELVTTLMEKAYSGRVVLTASSGVATNWLDAH